MLEKKKQEMKNRIKEPNKLDAVYKYCYPKQRWSVWPWTIRIAKDNCIRVMSITNAIRYHKDEITKEQHEYIKTYLFWHRKPK